MRYGSIYVATNTVTGEQYVGQTRQRVERRWKCHVNAAQYFNVSTSNISQVVAREGKVKRLFTLLKVN